MHVLRHPLLRIFVFLPIGGAVDYIFTDAVKIGLITDDMFVKVTLPNCFSGRTAQLINLFRRCRFK